MIKFLFENGADFKCKTTTGVNTLHMAAQGNQPKVINALLYEYECFDINCVDNSGATPLIWAAFCGSEAAVTFLLAQPGVNVNAQNAQGETALHLTVANGNNPRPANIVKRLLIKGISIHTEDDKGRTAIDFARKNAEKRNSATLKEAVRSLEKADESNKGCWTKLKESLMI